MTDPQTRRKFLSRMAVGATGGGVLALLKAESVFAAELDATPIDPLGPAYSLEPGLVYFNHASIGTIPKIVQKAMVDYLAACEANPWLHMWGGAWEGPREAVRATAARFLGCQAGEIALTHNTTEGFNLLAQGLPLGKGDEVLFSSLNHAGASRCWEHHATSRGFTVKSFEFPIDAARTIDEAFVLEQYGRHITKKTRVLVFPHVDNIIGLRHPLAGLTRLARESGVEFVAADGAQAAGMIPVALEESGIDFYAMSPHKWLQAPKGLGLLYVRKEVQASLRPMWVTWGQTSWKDTVRIFEDYGTRNLASVLALGHAIQFQEKLEDRDERLRRLRKQVRAKVDGQAGLQWGSPDTWRMGSSVYSVGIEGPRSSAVAKALFEKHHCVTRPFGSQGLNALRLSLNLANTPEQIERFFAALAEEL